MQIGKAEFWKYFEEISAIPHGSYNTDKISNYISEFAKAHNLEYVQDELGNVVIYKAATPGFEDRPSLCIQGHIDMVAVKTPDCNKDLLTEGLDLEVDGEWLKAKGTSLGGDDGIAVAYALSILASDKLEHPALEMVFTVNEEVAMEGAFGFDKNLLKSSTIINLDNETEGEFLTGCAGGAKIDIELPVERKLRTAMVYELKVSGLKGGHSGIDIADNRVSAATVISRFLCELKMARTRIIDVRFGEKDNVIANSGYIKFICSAPNSDVMEILDFYANVLKDEFKTREPELKIEYAYLGEQKEVNALHKADSERLMDFLWALPQGVDTFSADVPGLVETSVNIGVAELAEDRLTVKCLVRSSYDSAKQALCDKVVAVANLAGAKARQYSDYPGWAYRVDSPIREKVINIYREMYGIEPVLTAIHAGVECGVFVEKLGDADCISFGPTMVDVHSVKERLNIPSSERVYEFLTELIKA